MQTPIPLLAGLLLVLACGNVAAQVTTDPRALDQLQPTGQAHPPAKPPPPRPAQQRPTRAKTTASTTAHPPAVAPPQEPLVPIAPPPPPVIPEPVSVPVRPVSTPAPPAVADDAPGTATQIEGGLRLTFGTDRADLNPATDTALRALVHGAATPTGSSTTFTVTAYAAGTPEDPSTPRRLSLSRALTVRSVLINEGIASIRIYVKALGAAAPAIADGPPDRADIVVGSTPTETSAQAPSPPKSTP
jgi:outer membrane protein OmpA-like peptidoglycan-associated protein